MFVLKKTENLFGTDWMEKIKLWDMPINSFCQNLGNSTKEAIKDLKEMEFFFLVGFVGVIR